jgi:exopolysaccharide biosynthesis predicted pyruvyltransferase EpsI
MSNLFDKNYKVKNKFVIYEHAHIKKNKLSNVIKDFPVGNNRMDFKEAVTFLASGEYIITNSYHGTYWGILLNRKVICIPYSTKFNYFEFPPIYRSVENWNKNLEECNSYINALNVARYKNILFYRKVIKFLNN